MILSSTPQKTLRTRIKHLPTHHHKALVFGHGESYCLGSHLARSELGYILNVCLNHLSAASEVLEHDTQWAPPDLVLRGLNRMSVRVG